MAETITPVVHGGKRRPYLVASALHVLGATLSSAVLGLLLAGLGAVLFDPAEPWPAFVVAGGAFLYLLRDVFDLPVPLDRKRQVPEWWRTFFSPPVAALLYGLGLGAGVFTYLTFGTFGAVMVAALAAADPLTGVLLCAPFGLARGLAVVAATWRGRADRMDRLDDLAMSNRPRLLNAAVLVALSATGFAYVL